MNPFWKTLITGVVTIAAIFSARVCAQWVHHNVIRSPNAQVSTAQPSYVKSGYVQPSYVQAKPTYAPATSNFAARTAAKPYKPNAFPPRS